MRNFGVSRVHDEITLELAADEISEGNATLLQNTRRCEPSQRLLSLCKGPYSRWTRVTIKLFYEALAEDTLAVAVDSGNSMARMLRIFYSKSATMDSKDGRVVVSRNWFYKCLCFRALEPFPGLNCLKCHFFHRTIPSVIRLQRVADVEVSFW